MCCYVVVMYVVGLARVLVEAYAFKCVHLSYAHIRTRPHVARMYALLAICVYVSHVIRCDVRRCDLICACDECMQACVHACMYVMWCIYVHVCLHACMYATHCDAMWHDVVHGQVVV